MEFIVFTDESSITASRYPSISAFSMPLSSYNHLYEKHKIILQESRVSEFKWNKLKSANYYYCAEKMINLVFKNINKYQLRIDSITWDNNDSRHAIKRRHDVLNYERMFFHLLKNSMRKRKMGAAWHIRPDERGGIDWLRVRRCLYYVGQKRKIEHSIWKALFLDPSFIVKSFEEKKSDEDVLIQIPDLFSGMSSFSRQYYKEYLSWKQQTIETEQLSLFDSTSKSLSSKKNYSCQLIDFFYGKCKQDKMGVSLNTNKCLCTFKSTNPINFWHYQPQGDYDKAPTK